MICIPILGPSHQEAQHQIVQALPYADLIELRLDHFIDLDFNALTNLQAQFQIPMMFTLRSVSQGGNYMGSEEKRLNELRSLANLKPAYLDLESEVPSNFITKIAQDHPEVKLILSYHNFLETPKDLQGLYQSMKNSPAWGYKIAVKANSSIDALRFLIWAKHFKGNLIAISMGIHGQLSRILAPIIRSPFTYASLSDDQQTAPGQLSAETLIERYHYKAITSKTAIYGLLGDPVDKSISDITHNDLFHVIKENAIYIKIQVKLEELQAFLALAKQLPFRGFSVTMPLKEETLHYSDEVLPEAREIGAINTLMLVEDNWIGCNTDGKGALNAIEKAYLVQGKRLVIIGAGGAAKAIAHEAYQRGAKIVIVNRDKHRAQEIASHLNQNAPSGVPEVIGKGLDQMEECAAEGYDILINTTPIAMPIEEKDITSKCLLAMEIKTKPKDSLFLECASKKGAMVIYGYQMFIEQALCQYEFWFNGRFSIPKYRAVLEKKALQCLSLSS